MTGITPLIQWIVWSDKIGNWTNNKKKERMHLMQTRWRQWVLRQMAWLTVSVIGNDTITGVVLCEADNASVLISGSLKLIYLWLLLPHRDDEHGLFWVELKNKTKNAPDANKMRTMSPKTDGMIDCICCDWKWHHHRNTFVWGWWYIHFDWWSLKPIYLQLLLSCRDDEHGPFWAGLLRTCLAVMMSVPSFGELFV